ncbi:NUDIX hydrolase, partial [Clavibacter michiganensis subsp. insidiosus]
RARRSPRRSRPLPSPRTRGADRPSRSRRGRRGRRSRGRRRGGGA